MRLLRDEQPVKHRKPSSFGTGTDNRKTVVIFKHIREEDGFKEHICYLNPHMPLLTP